MTKYSVHLSWCHFPAPAQAPGVQSPISLPPRKHSKNAVFDCSYLYNVPYMMHLERQHGMPRVVIEAGANNAAVRCVLEDMGCPVANWLLHNANFCSRNFCRMAQLSPLFIVFFNHNFNLHWGWYFFPSQYSPRKSVFISSISSFYVILKSFTCSRHKLSLSFSLTPVFCIKSTFNPILRCWMFCVDIIRYFPPPHVLSHRLVCWCQKVTMRYARHFSLANADPAGRVVANARQRAQSLLSRSRYSHGVNFHIFRHNSSWDSSLVSEF